MPDSSASSAGGRLLGVNQLQGAIDKFSAAVNKLDNVIQSIKSTPTGLARSSGGNGSSAQQGQQYGTFPAMNNPFQATGTIKPVLSYNTQTGTTQPTGTYRFTYSGQVPAAPNGGGPNVPPPQSQTGGVFGMPTTLGAAAKGLLGNITSFGSGQLPLQAAMSAYLQMGTLAAPNGMSISAASQALRAAAFGSGPSNINAIAANGYDAAQGQALINWASGGFAGANPMGLAMTGAANMFGYANQGLGYMGAAQMAQTMYSPTMSMRMMMMGYPVIPRRLGGGQPAIMPSVLGGMMQRWYGRRSVSQQILNAGMAPGGNIYNNLVYGLGLSGQELTSTEAMLSAFNKLAAKGYSSNRIQELFAGARNDNQGAINTLTGAGITQSDLQVLKNRTATQTATSANEMGGFTAGLRQSVGLLTQFNKILSFITGGPLGKALGFIGGVGAAGGIMKDVSSLVGNAAGIITGGVSRLFGGAASPGTGSGGSIPGRPARAASGPSGAAVAAVGWAEQELGMPYVWGGDSPQTGFDCSGLTMWSYKQAGVSIPRTSQEQWAALSRAGRAVPLNAVEEGDLVFNAGVGDGGTYNSPGHVAMMISSKQIIEAPYTGADVRIRAYNPAEWQHAGRPTGPGVGGTAPSSTAGTSTGPSGPLGPGRLGGVPSSNDEAENISSALGGMAMGIGGPGGLGGVGNGIGSTGRGNGTAGSTPPAPSNPSGNVKLGKQMAAAMGWTGSQWNDLYALWMRESGWQTTATNSSSGAYGIPQSLPANKMASAGADWRTNPATQIKWGLGYIKDRYGSPAGAWAHEQAFNWYAWGTSNARRGLAIVGDNGPEVVDFAGGERVTPMSRAMSAGTAGRAQVIVQLNFGPGAIKVSGMSGSDVSSSAREIAYEIGQYLESETVFKKIAAGVA